MPDLSRKDFVDFLTEKGNGSYKCTFCGHGELAFNVVEGTNAPEDGVRTPAVVTTPLGNGPGVHSFYSVSCTNCGNTLFFHQNQVRIWKGARAKEGSNG